MNLTDRKFCETIPEQVEKIPNDPTIRTSFPKEDMLRLARLALAETDARPERRFIFCRDCEAWRTFCGKPLGDELRVCQIDHNENQTKYGHQGCCEGFPRVTP